MQSSNSIKQAWHKEYENRGIPSSFRNDPTKTVVGFVSWLKKHDIPLQGLVADIGCGLGRNSFFLASQGFSVIGLELLEENVNSVNDQAQLLNLPVEAFAQDASCNWPIKPNSLAIAIDVFCYKHIVCKEKQLKYRNQLWKSLNPDGFYFISLASEKDGFYGPLLAKSTQPKQKLIVDPYSNIPSFLYSLEELKEEFSDFFELVQIEEQLSTSPMHGNNYQRVVINAIFKKLPQITHKRAIAFERQAFILSYYGKMEGRHFQSVDLITKQNGWCDGTDLKKEEWVEITEVYAQGTAQHMTDKSHAINQEAFKEKHNNLLVDPNSMPVNEAIMAGPVYRYSLDEKIQEALQKKSVKHYLYKENGFPSKGTLLLVIQDELFQGFGDGSEVTFGMDLEMLKEMASVLVPKSCFKKVLLVNGRTKFYQDSEKHTYTLFEESK
jgi:SAM-dependent methyltransferase